MGPTALFDKSFIQSLSIDESVWFNHFYVNNICPLFYIETMADLSKKMRNGRTAEDVVGNIANKTPESGTPNTFHLDICRANLYGSRVPMAGQILIPYRKPVSNDGKVGVLIEETPENTALIRWQNRQFEEVERITAKNWRNKVAYTELGVLKEKLKYLPEDYKKLKTLEEISKFVDDFLMNKNHAMKHAHLVEELQQIDKSDMSNIVARWIYLGQKPIMEYAPYSAFVLKVDLIFILAMYKGIISDQRPSNGVDVDYLKYLPFCSVFVSQDKIHKMLFPFLKREKQQFLWGIDLKISLKLVNEYFMGYPEEIKEKGIYCFATQPPVGFDNLVADSWEVFMGKKLYRGKQDLHFPKKNEKLANMMDGFTPIDESMINSENLDFISIQKKINKRKGSWYILPVDID